MEYFEDLAALKIICPHEDAFSPDGKQQYFRVIKENISTSDGFLPTEIKDNKLRPDECICKSVSIYDNLEALKNGYFRNPARKKKPRNIAVLTLTEKCGLLKQTFAAGHHSWWRSKEFNPATATVTTIEP
jgi:hypothetical protein